MSIEIIIVAAESNYRDIESIGYIKRDISNKEIIGKTEENTFGVEFIEPLFKIRGTPVPFPPDKRADKMCKRAFFTA